MRARLWTAAAIMLTVAACGPADDSANDQAALDSLDAAPPASVPAPPQLGDSEVAAIVVTANSADIEGAQAASTKATNAEVKAFAERMITDHTASNEEAQALVQRVGVTPAESQVSTQMKSDHERAMTELGALSGAEFDRAYIAHEIAMHQAVLNAIDQQLLPSAQNAELRALLEKTRPVIESHLQHAQSIQPKLGAATTTGN